MSDLEFAKQVGLMARKSEKQDTKLTDQAPTQVRRIIQDGRISFIITSSKIEEQAYGSASVVGHPTLSAVPWTVGAPTASVTTESSQTSSNKMTLDGREQVALWLVNQSANYPSYIAMGTDSSAPSETDSALFAEINRFPIDQVTVTGKSIEFRALRPGLSQSGQIVRELGLFNAASGGTMFARATVSAYTLLTDSQNYLYITMSGSNQVPVMDGMINEVNNWLSDGSGAYPTHIAWGTDSSYITSSTHSTMIHEDFRNAITLTSGPIEAKGWQDRWESQMALTQGTGSTYYQSGLWTAASNGTLMMYGNNPPISKNDRFVVDTDYGVKQI